MLYSFTTLGNDILHKKLFHSHDNISLISKKDTSSKTTFIAKESACHSDCHVCSHSTHAIANTVDTPISFLNIIFDRDFNFVFKDFRLEVFYTDLNSRGPPSFI